MTPTATDLSGQAPREARGTFMDHVDRTMTALLAACRKDFLADEGDARAMPGAWPGIV